MVRHTFNKIQLSMDCPTFCRECGKKRRRRVSDFQTINPYNVNETGQPKSISEIHTEVQASVLLKFGAMKRDGIVCQKCGPAHMKEATPR